MRSYVETSGGHIGYGMSREEALNDLYINKCRISFSDDKEGRFVKRSEELCPWLPRPNMLHLSSVGCLMYQDGYLSNTKNNAKVEVTIKGRSIYYYLRKVCGNELSYTDITVVARQSIDEFFKNISGDFVPIIDMPYIKLQGTSDGFIPDVVYTSSHGVLIGVGEKEIGMKLMGDDLYLTVEVNEDSLQIAMLSYIACKLDLVFAEGGS